MEEEFEATGCREGFMISHPYSTPGRDGCRAKTLPRQSALIEA
jgi:hypothetical protein